MVRILVEFEKKIFFSHRPLKQAFQKWLKTMLTWDPTIRGFDHQEKGKKEKCFIHLEKILEMKVLLSLLIPSIKYDL